MLLIIDTRIEWTGIFSKMNDFPAILPAIWMLWMLQCSEMSWWERIISQSSSSKCCRWVLMAQFVIKWNHPLVGLCALLAVPRQLCSSELNMSQPSTHALIWNGIFIHHHQSLYLNILFENQIIAVVNSASQISPPTNTVRCHWNNWYKE